MTITYVLYGNLYLNITNKCNCACVFCVRRGGDGVGDAESLWLPREPGADEIIGDLKKRDLSEYGEVVFCGYGEPTESLDALLEVCRYIKSAYPKIIIRLNTNGLADLSHKKPVAPLLKGLVDSASISLNAPSESRYLEITNPVFGKGSFEAMLAFAKSVKENIGDVTFTVVDVLTAAELEMCEKISADLGIPLRVRGKI